MKLEGVHHVTAITGDAPRNVEFYAGTLGLRSSRRRSTRTTRPSTTSSTRTSGRPAPTSPSSSTRARAGPRGRRDGSPVVWRVASEDALDFWQKRLDATCVPEDGRCVRRSRGLGIELAVVETRTSR
jgi:glyoxalase family protein